MSAELQLALQTARDHAKCHRVLYAGLEGLRELHLQLANEAEARAEQIRQALEETS